MTKIVTSNIDTTTKEAAEAVFDQMGLTTSSAIKLFLNQVATTKSIPFQPTTITKPGFTSEQKTTLLQMIQDAKQQKSHDPFAVIDEMFGRL